MNQRSAAKLPASGIVVQRRDQPRDPGKLAQRNHAAPDDPLLADFIARCGPSLASDREGGSQSKVKQSQTAKQAVH